MSKWYVLWVLTGRERKVVKELENWFTDEAIKPFIPKWESLFKRGGKIKKELNILFPGYVFIESELETEEFRRQILHIIRKSKSCIKLLDYGKPNEIALKEEEVETLQRFYNSENCIEASTGYAEGDKVFIKSGPLVGMEGFIKKINKKKMEASLKIEFMGDIRQITLGLALLKKSVIL